MTHPYRVPHYPRNTDYSTNAASYYDDLARKNELMKHLAMRIWEYDKELSKRFAQWDKNLEDFDEEVLKLLQKWMDDGTFEHIINHHIFNQLNTDLSNLQQVVEDLDAELKNDLSSIKNRLAKIDGIGTSRLYVYVNGATGNDVTADGTQGKPYKTIQACLDAIPKTINQDRFIMITPGTYDEALSIKSVSGSAVYLQSTNPAQYYKIQSAVFYDINGLVRVENAEFTGRELDYNLRFSRCNYGTSHNNRFTDDKIGIEKWAIEFDGTQGSVNACHFNAQFTCIFAQNGSHVRVDSTNTHGSTPSTRAVSIFSAHVYFNELVEWIDQCVNPITVRRGGRYTWDRPFIVLTMENGWESLDQEGNETYVARAFKDDANMVHLFGAIRGGTVGTVNAFVLPEGYRPVYNTHVFAAFVDDNTIAKIVIDRIGQAQVQRGNNLPYVSLSGISFYSGR